MSGLNECLVETYQLTRTRVLKVYQDPDPLCPSEHQDESAFLIAGHRDFSVPFPGEKGEPTPEQAEEFAKRGTHHVFPIEAYIHSGVRLAFSSEGNFVDRRWDVSNPVGYIFLAKSEWKRRAKARKYAEGMLREWNDYLSGNVYGFMFEGTGDPDSCWGFYGDSDPWLNGMADHFDDKDRARLERVHPKPSPVGVRRAEIARKLGVAF